MTIESEEFEAATGGNDYVSTKGDQPMQVGTNALLVALIAKVERLIELQVASMPRAGRGAPPERGG